MGFGVLKSPYITYLERNHGSVGNTKPAMVNVINNKRCAAVDDDGTRLAQQPSFNFPGEKGGVRCAAHKLDGMVNVVDKTCDHVDDDGTASRRGTKIQFPGEKGGVRCFAHKVDGMVDVANKLCEHGNRIGRCAECPLGDTLYKTMCTSCRVVRLTRTAARSAYARAVRKR